MTTTTPAFWICLVSAVVTFGCAPGATTAPPRQVRVEVAPEGSPLAPNREQPVLYPPEILPCYVPTHRLDPTGTVLVGEHWVFVKIADAKWFIDKERELRYEEEVGKLGAPAVAHASRALREFGESRDAIFAFREEAELIPSSAPAPTGGNK